MWTITNTVSKGEYNYVSVTPEHPNATKNGYVLEHRIVMENILGRMLNAWEIVHHKDENKKNNEPDNLEVMQIEDHSRHHHKTGRKFVLMRCPKCKAVFERERRKTHLVKGGTATFCSLSCRPKRKDITVVTEVIREYVK